jgi:hypothetical protein
MRRQRVDIEALRSAGKCLAHEKYIGVRVIDNNIQKDIPPYVSYIKQSRRSAIFKSVDGPINTDDQILLEEEFTRVVRYPQWEFDYIRWIDGTILHGYDWLEVLYDDTKPGFCATNHVGCIDLIFDLSVKNIQDSRMVIRRYRPTLVVLDELAEKHGFDAKAVKLLRQRLKQNQQSTNSTDVPAYSTNDTTSAVQLFKVMYKERGIVFVGWHCPNTGVKDWLRAPRMFWNGIKTKEETIDFDPITMLPTPKVEWRRIPERTYPYFAHRYRITEDPTIAQTQGRGEMDLHIQEASCTVWSGFVNQTQESSLTMWSPENPNMNMGGTGPKQLDFVIRKGAIWDTPMKAFNSKAPDPMVPKALDMLATQNADNINQPAWTVNNRQDSRKTATEVDSATEAQTKLSAVSVVTLSVSMLPVHEAQWRIIQSQALQGNIKFMVGPDGQNREDIISRTYSLTPAGDVDYVEREEQAQKMQQDWPVIQTTGAKDVFMEEYIRLRYPKNAEQYITAIRQANAKNMVIQSLGGLLKTAVTDESGQLRPEWQAHSGELQQIQQQAQQVLTQP